MVLHGFTWFSCIYVYEICNRSADPLSGRACEKGSSAPLIHSVQGRKQDHKQGPEAGPEAGLEDRRMVQVQC